ncbi:MAG TPA: SgcJ/EcaC family oxidoreductase [Gemmatimonadaceae bacterium]|nr:SgcJ/EcaC family oxidoreductase [Gemmatimonadaceae bacterium]
MTSPTAPDQSTSSHDYTTSDTRAQTTAPTADVREAVRAVTKTFLEAFRQGDAAAMAALYTTDGQVLPPNSEIAEGRAAVESFWRETIAFGFSGATLDLAEIYHTPGDRIATEVGRYTILAADGQQADKGKYVVIWHRDDGGRWLIHRDIWASNLPLPGAS